MTEELDKKLVEKYPKIFADRYKDKRETAMCWGFECDDGWYWLIDNLCNSIQEYTDNNGVGMRIKNKFIRYCVKSLSNIRDEFMKSDSKFLYNVGCKIKHSYIVKLTSKFNQEEYIKIPQFVASQVKEKFGSLRFYGDGGDDVIDGMIWLAEIQSFNMCEKCGSIDDVSRTRGWIKVLCKKHMSEYKQLK